MSIDLLLDRATGDLDLSSGTLALTRDRGEIVRQRLEARLALFRGAWFLDLEAGRDWESVLGGVGTAEDARREALEGLQEDPDVATARASATVDRTRRVVTVEVSATLATGELLEFSTTVAP